MYSYGNICCSLSYFGFSVTDAYVLWLASSQNETKYLAFQAFVFERTYLMKVIPETRRVHLIWYLRFYLIRIWLSLLIYDFLCVSGPSFINNRDFRLSKYISRVNSRDFSVMSGIFLRSETNIMYCVLYYIEFHVACASQNVNNN